MLLVAGFHGIRRRALLGEVDDGMRLPIIEQIPQVL